ncbi:carbohydrate-binding family 9-like protein [uncultured Duncaniella sp.]|uniref:carbohydrate-binding family 9-like protein n=1 Tax=uncultured Duncaniella sp. TaxID=2768039 RepID=UPI0025ED9F22|nr:carbohydrate-binding family 9-like protein [uncultured Duncaniella sp.]
MPQTLNVPFIADLDFLNTDAIFNRLESSGVRHSIGELNWKDQYPYHPLTTFTIAHSAKYIYVNFFVRCNYLRAVNYENNSPVYEDSCVMFYVQPLDSQEYSRFEFNCIGTVNAVRQTGEDSSVRFTDEEIASISLLPSCGRRPFREIEGLFTWDILVAIPLKLVGAEYNGGPLKLKGNFFKCASGTSQPHFLSWSPVKSKEPDFLRPESFSEIILE